MTGEADQAGLGGTLAQAQQGGFFSWFHLSAVDDSDTIPAKGRVAEGAAWHRFRPSGLRFNPLVELEVGVDADGRIEAACLGIDRAFISAVSIRPFARDIAKSYLQWLLPAAAADDLAAELELIAAFCDGESVVIVHSSAPRPSWRTWWRKRNGGEADVFMGIAARAERQTGGTRTVFENLIEKLPRGVASRRPVLSGAVPGKDDDAWLRITVAARK